MELTAELREKFGRAVTSLRKGGLIPGELYGRGVANMHVSVSRREFAKVFREAGESAMVTLSVGGERRPVLIHDVSFDPVTDEVMSVDFYQVRLDEKIRVKVPLAFTGESAAVKAGGVLVRAMQDVEVEALPAEIPHSIDASLDSLTEAGKSLYVSHLNVPAGVRVLVDPQTVVATVKAKMTEEEEQRIAAAGSVEAVKVEAEEKKAEREAKEGAPAEAAAAPEAKPEAKKTESKK